MKKNQLFLVCALLLAACAPETATPAPVVETATSTSVPATLTPQPPAVWIAPAVPDPLREATLASGMPEARDRQSATHIVDISSSVGSLWIYALVAPFPTVRDDVTYADLLAAWQGASSGPLTGHVFLLAESTLAALTAQWGAPASSAV